jgi:hypothetical protein
MVTNVTIHFLVTMHTSDNKVTNVPTVIFASMVAKVTTGMGVLYLNERCADFS